jgi:DMSO/TMAO reductase YedYZ molybdopterin-dependent catalytic subunit
VLTAEVTPQVPVASWTFTVEGLVERETKWTWEEIHALPQSSYEGDIHCVTTWSKLGTSFKGVSVDTLLAAAVPLPAATHGVAFSYTSQSAIIPPVAYSTNFQLDDITGGKAWVVWEHEGEPLPVEHGGPARLIVPHLYFWKSAKWVAGIRLLDHDQPGFWERNGYHNRGDPWLEQRYEGD